MEELFAEKLRRRQPDGYRFSPIILPNGQHCIGVLRDDLLICTVAILQGNVASITAGLAVLSDLLRATLN